MAHRRRVSRRDGDIGVAEPEAEREQRRAPHGVVPPVTDEATLEIVGDTVATWMMLEGRRVFEADRERHRQPALWLDIADQYVDQCVAHLLAREPEVEDSVDFVEPWHRDRRAHVDDDDGARTGLGNGGDELVLAPGQFQGVSVVTLALPVVVGPDHDDGEVGLGGEFDCVVHGSPRMGGARRRAVH